MTASGTYLDAAPEFLRNQTLNGTNGYYLLSPLRTESAVLLVVRGFVTAASSGAPPASVTRAPSGPVTVTARLQTVSTATDDATALPDGMIESVNAAQQAARLGAPVYQAYATLTADQPGTSGVSVLPDPDLSNPAGGAYEGQHFAYIVQWYLFALLALAAPFVIRRHEIKDAQRRFLGIDSGEDQVDLEPGGEQLRREIAGSAPRNAIGTNGARLAVRTAATITRRSDVTPQQLRRAARLADRYGRSLGLDYDAAAATAGHPTDAPARAVARPEPAPRIPDSARTVHRSEGDDFHGAYNDYLWELALADGNIPQLLCRSRSPNSRNSLKSAPSSTANPMSRRADRRLTAR